MGRYYSGVQLYFHVAAFLVHIRFETAVVMDWNFNLWSRRKDGAEESGGSLIRESTGISSIRHMELSVSRKVGEFSENGGCSFPEGLPKLLMKLHQKSSPVLLVGERFLD